MGNEVSNKVEVESVNERNLRFKICSCMKLKRIIGTK